MKRPLGTSLALAAGLASVAAWPTCDGDAGEALIAYGTVEATEVRVAPLVGGTVLEVLFREGATVNAGDVIARIDAADVELQLAQAAAALRSAEARERLTRSATRREDLQSVQQARRLSQVQTATAKRELARVEKLFQSGAVTSKQLDDARSALEMAQAQADQTQAMLDKAQHGARTEEIEAAQAAREQAEAAVKLLKTSVGRCEVRAPSNGRVIYRLVEPGEVARPGVPLMVLGDIAHPYVDIYVPEQHVGAVRVGAAADVAADALAGRVFRGTVTHVSDEAEFTPKNVQTAEQRARLVFRVRIAVDNGDLSLKPGMPARAAFSTATATTASIPGEAK